MAQSEELYDLFVSYAEADGAWVDGYLLDALESAGVKLHTEEAFRLGTPRLLEFERAIQHSRRVLLILSPAYLAEGFTQFTDLLAQSYGLEASAWPVVPLLLYPVELPPRLAMLIALDATDAANWPNVLERLCAELQRPLPSPPPRPDCPYPGMVPFREADSDRFFGRDEDVEALIQRLRLSPFQAVIGPSGSGKSSLVFAGLIPALRNSGLFGSGEWLVRALRPGESPMNALDTALDGNADDVSRAAPKLLAAQPGARRLLLIVDQFEELFTVARSEIGTFQRTLARLAQTPDCYVVLTVRADFYADLMASPLWSDIQAHRVEVLPLGREGLRQAIARPAEDVGVYADPALVERLIADAGSEPGVLPLVQETLVLLWERLQRRYLPLSAYETLGDADHTGLQVAMAQRADAGVAALSPQQQAVARRIFLRLVQFGEGRADTRRQQSVDDLRATGDEQTFESTLRHLSAERCRLLILSGEEQGRDRRVDIAHEALIGGWPTLRGWLDSRRAAEQARRRLEAKADEWMRLEGEGGLLDEVELAEAKRWLESPDAQDLGHSEALSALAEASGEAIEQERIQQRRTARRQFMALGAIAVLIIVALGIGLWSSQRIARQQEEAVMTVQAYADEQERLAQSEATARADTEVQRQEALDARGTAVAKGQETINALGTAEAERNRADRQAQIALARQLAAQADLLYSQQGDDLQHSVLQAVESMRRYPTLEGDQILRQGLASLPLAQMIHKAKVNAVAYSPDGRWLASAGSDSTVRVWDLETGEEVTRMEHDREVWAVAFSPDGQQIASGSGSRYGEASGLLSVWDIAAGQTIVQVAHGGPVNAVAFSPDGRWIASGGRDGIVHVWDISAAGRGTDTVPEVMQGAHDGSVTSIAFSPDGRWVVSGGSDETARVWSLASSSAGEAAIGQEILTVGTRGSVFDVALSPGGQWIATGTDQPYVQVWDVTTGQELTGIELDDPVWAVDFSPNGQWLAIGSGKEIGAGQLSIWRAMPDEVASPLAIDARVNDVAFGPDGQQVAVASEGGTIQVWRPFSGQEGVWIDRGSGWYAAAVSPDGRWWATGEGDNRVHLWDITTGQEVGQSQHSGPINAIAFSSDSQWIASGSGDVVTAGPGEFCVWSLAPTAGQEILRVEYQAPVYVVAFSPDGRWVASGSGKWRNPGQVQAWRTDTWDQAIQLKQEGFVADIAFTPDGEWMATTDGSAVRIWETATTKEMSPIAHTGFVHTIALSPDGQWLVSVSNRGAPVDKVQVWPLALGSDGEAATGQQTYELTHDIALVNAIVFSPDGRWLASASGGRTARVWSLAPSSAGQEVARAEHQAPVWDVAFSPDGQWVASVSGFVDSDSERSGQARLWEAATGRERTRLEHGRPVIDAAFSADGRWLLTTGMDGMLRSWLWQADDLAAEACARLTRNLTPEEWMQFISAEAPYACTCSNLPPCGATP